MAFTVEDGTIVAGANSYCSLADADSYFGDRGNAVWAALDNTTKQALLVKATDFLVQRYRGRWKGMRVNINQALDWPRAGVQTEDFFDPQSDARPYPFPFNQLAFLVPTNSVPKEVKAATCEAAIRANSGTLNPDLARGGKIKRRKIDVIETEFMDDAPSNTLYQAVEQLIAPYLQIAGSREMVRS